MVENAPEAGRGIRCRVSGWEGGGQCAKGASVQNVLERFFPAPPLPLRYPVRPLLLPEAVSGGWAGRCRIKGKLAESIIKFIL